MSITEKGKKYPVFSERLRTQRKASGLTQERAATLLNVERSTYAKYETGQSMPHQDTLLALADLFRVSVDYLLGKATSIVTELRDDGSLPGLTLKATAMVAVFDKLTNEQQESLLNIAYNYSELNAAIKAYKPQEK